MPKKTSPDTELTQICVPTKKIYLETPLPSASPLPGGTQGGVEIVLRPFKQRHFASAIAIINKYFDQFNSVRENYVGQRKAILDRYEDEATRNLALAELDGAFNEGMEIAKAILGSGGEGIGEDIKAIVEMSIYKATQITTVDGATERTPVEPELDDLTWGECLVLLGSTVGLNMDFFAQNSQAMNLMQVMQNEPTPSDKPKAGEKLSAV